MAYKSTLAPSISFRFVGGTIPIWWLDFVQQGIQPSSKAKILKDPSVFNSFFTCDPSKILSQPACEGCDACLPGAQQKRSDSLALEIFLRGKRSALRLATKHWTLSNGKTLWAVGRFVLPCFRKCLKAATTSMAESLWDASLTRLNPIQNPFAWLVWRRFMTLFNGRFSLDWTRKVTFCWLILKNTTFDKLVLFCHDPSSGFWFFLKFLENGLWRF